MSELFGVSRAEMESMVKAVGYPLWWAARDCTVNEHHENPPFLYEVEPVRTPGFLSPRPSWEAQKGTMALGMPEEVVELLGLELEPGEVKKFRIKEVK
jgi:hypothetical protein